MHVHIMGPCASTEIQFPLRAAKFLSCTYCDKCDPGPHDMLRVLCNVFMSGLSQTSASTFRTA